jgi:hypothetical protein
MTRSVIVIPDDAEAERVELCLNRRAGLSATELIARRRLLPVMDATKVREDIDAILNPTV